jgi:hypothetical protein
MTTVKRSILVLLLFLICVLEKLEQEHLEDVMVTAVDRWCVRTEGSGFFTVL